MIPLQRHKYRTTSADKRVIPSSIHTGSGSSDHRQSTRQPHITYLLHAVGLALLLLGGLLHADAQYWIYTVRPGDNIRDLTERYCTSARHWRLIQSLNNVPPDRQIQPGTKLRFPLQILKYQPATALVTELHGSARLFRSGGQEAVPLAVQESLRTGDRIVTGPGANITLHFADGSELQVLDDSEVVMDTLSAWGTTGMVDTRVRLQGGRSDTRVKPAQGPGSRYQIITPAAVAAVRGTRFRVAAEPGKTVTRNEVTAGIVSVGDARSSQDVPAGFGVVTEAGKPPQQPRALLPPPGIRTPPLQKQLPLRFGWYPVTDARAYRYQIAPDAEFRTLLVDERVAQPQAEWPDLPDGHYALRVRAIDKVGLEGLDSVQVFDVDARPLAPVPTVPVGGEVTHDARPHFTWEAAGDVKGYHFEMAHDTDFKEILLRTTLDADGFQLTQTLAPGEYRWRVAGIDQDGRQGPFSATAHFTYRPLPQTPGPLAEPVIGENTLLFEWDSLENATAYRLQLAEDPEFEQLVVDEHLSQPRMELRRPPARVYYARVRGENAAGEAGPFSPPLELEVPPHHYWWLLIFTVPLLLVL